MTKHQNLSGRMLVLSAAPASPVEGDEYFDSTNNVWRRYDGSAWRNATTGTTTSTSSSTSTTSSTSTS